MPGWVAGHGCPNVGCAMGRVDAPARDSGVRWGHPQLQAGAGGKAGTWAKMPGTDFSLRLGGDRSACLCVGQKTTDKTHRCHVPACIPLHGLDLQDVSFHGGARQSPMWAGKACGGEGKAVTGTCASAAERWAIRKREK